MDGSVSRSQVKKRPRQADALAMNFSRVSPGNGSRVHVRDASEHLESDFLNLVAVVARGEMYPEDTPSRRHGESMLRVLAAVEAWPQESAS